MAQDVQIEYNGSEVKSLELWKMKINAWSLELFSAFLCYEVSRRVRIKQIIDLKLCLRVQRVNPPTINDP